MSDVVRADSRRFQTLLERHAAFWEGSTQETFLRSTSVGALSTAVALPQPDGSVITRAERVEPDMIHPSLLIDEVEHWDPRRLDATLRLQGQFMIKVGIGDLMPLSVAWSKIPWGEAMLGCPIKMTEGQIWAEPYPGDPEEVIRRGVHLEGNPWFELYLEFLRQLQWRLGECFPVSTHTLVRGTSDLVAAVMGVQPACLGWIDNPAFMARLLRVCTDTILTIVEAGYRVLQPYKGGYPSGYALWAPEKSVSTQADHSTLLSPKMYQQHILPYDLEVIRSCPLAVMHIHNQGLHVAPLLVEIPELDVLEVAVDPYPTGERKPYEIEMLRMITAHKPLILDVNLPSFEEGEWLLAQLPDSRICFNAQFEPFIYEALPTGVPGGETWLLH
jgi:hypothetical protein